ncbi:hypothetical protein J5N97_003732 [Dioscorea zingiberensis]|uniref:Ubiquitin-like domain-containing protein n=1 Tax=Dioscorea zingiberensis TaxID=325984 RepID=A0A9D5D563_9LILI|nr:hypothetical protein J5N97_003732 [Dioscorea zingiberensis]
MEEEREVEIILKAVRILLPSIIKACDLRKLVASKCALPADQLKLVLRGKTLHDKKNDRDDGDDVLVRLENGGKAVADRNECGEVKPLKQQKAEKKDYEELERGREIIKGGIELKDQSSVLHSQPKCFVGTRAYIAPEVLRHSDTMTNEASGMVVNGD